MQESREKINGEISERILGVILARIPGGIPGESFEYNPGKTEEESLARVLNGIPGENANEIPRRKSGRNPLNISQELNEILGGISDRMY